jgi:VCBS repeat-containing protein
MPVFNGDNQPNVLTGGNLDDVLNGLAGNDTLTAGGGNDELNGGDDQDRLFGGAGNDTLNGGTGNDYFEDLEGNNLFSGGDGDDRFGGGVNVNEDIGFGRGNGADTATGGTGLDTFFVSARSVWNSDTYAIDTITDFTPGAGGDVLDLRNVYSFFTGLASGANPFTTGHLRFLQNGADSILQVDLNGPTGGTNFQSLVILQDRLATNLTSQNFNNGLGPNANNAPIANLDQGFVVNENGPAAAIASADLLLNDTDPNPGQTISFVGVTSALTAMGAALSVAGANISVTPGLSYQTLRAGQSAIDTFQYTIQDQVGSTAIGTVLVTMNGANDTPASIGLISGGSVTENALIGTIVADFDATDVDAGDTLNFSLTNSSSGRFAIDSATGVLTVANPALLNFEASTSHAITVRATDAGGLFVDRNFTISVIDINEGGGGSFTDSLVVNLFLAPDDGPWIVSGLNGNDLLTTLGGQDQIYGGSGNDTLSSGNGNDSLFGSFDFDILNARGGQDRLDGGAKADTLTGGLGFDIFDYNAIGDSGPFSQSDLITDFVRGADRINLSDIDANTLIAGDQAFVFIGGATFSNVAGQLRVFRSAIDTTLQADVNGDSVVDFMIRFDDVLFLNTSDFMM